MVSWPFSVCPLFLVFVLPGFYVLFVLSVRCFVFCSSLFFLFSQFIIRFSSLDLPLGSFSLPCLRPLISLCHSLSLSLYWFLSSPLLFWFFFPNSSSVLYGFSSSVRRFFVFSASQFSHVCVLPFSSVFPVLFPVRFSSPSTPPPLSSSSLLCLCPFFSGFFSSGYIFL
ncbi:hypothetical protein NC653_034440 [Populus alba x Populus x berolinensis]|uniref:Uncharacterized protein n=1 Tax=Populus alba x Populus x berolinensis TaxID=444605 RepID=A0AAD6LMJ2_9ROSI|nr:hypothetical protein NC653_034440 [Populus alba x Populus x berolinensis]